MFAYKDVKKIKENKMLRKYGRKRSEGKVTQGSEPPK